ncbi:MAG: alpha/beta hydrolase [Sphingobacteriales bacterium]|nr:alpha/beta hydrolase [Sphingobacteriales bacterium]
MEPNRLAYRNSTIGYYRFGSGDKRIFCFHGYGEEARAFEFLEKYAGSNYSFYAIDLPFHGKTNWQEGLNFTNDDLIQVVESLIDKGSPEQRSASEKITLMGFSLGGRVALSLYELIPAKFEKIILLAPDGLKVNFWYWLSTQTWLGNKLFAFTMKYPGWFFGLLKLLNSLRLVNSSVFKFVNHYVENPGIRKLLYQRWTSLRKLKPDLKIIKALIRKNNTPVRLVYGKHDRIILSVVGKKFRKGIGEQCSLSVIPSGHQVLHEKNAEYIIEALQR